MKMTCVLSQTTDASNVGVTKESTNLIITSESHCDYDEVWDSFGNNG